MGKKGTGRIKSKLPAAPASGNFVFGSDKQVPRPAKIQVVVRGKAFSDTDASRKVLEKCLGTPVIISGTPAEPRKPTLDLGSIVLKLTQPGKGSPPRRVLKGVKAKVSTEQGAFLEVVRAERVIEKEVRRPADPEDAISD